MKKKSGKKSGDGKFATGEDPRRGRGPRKGAPNAGRPPSEFKELMRGVASRPEALKRLRKLAGASKDVSDEVFLKAFKEAADRGFGKAVQPLEHGGPDGGPIPIASPAELRERVARELTGIATRKGARPVRR